MIGLKFILKAGFEDIRARVRSFKQSRCLAVRLLALEIEVCEVVAFGHIVDRGEESDFTVGPLHPLFNRRRLDSLVVKASELIFGVAGILLWNLLF